MNGGCPNSSDDECVEMSAPQERERILTEPQQVEESDCYITGDNQICNAGIHFPHSRKDCAMYPLDLKDPLKVHNIDQFRKHCVNCYCSVCDVESSKCTEWVSGDHSLYLNKLEMYEQQLPLHSYKNCKKRETPTACKDCMCFICDLPVDQCLKWATHCKIEENLAGRALKFVIANKDKRPQLCTIQKRSVGQTREDLREAFYPCSVVRKQMGLVNPVTPFEIRQLTERQQDVLWKLQCLHRSIPECVSLSLGKMYTIACLETDAVMMKSIEQLT